jgi:hypothetical protein
LAGIDEQVKREIAKQIHSDVKKGRSFFALLIDAVDLQR